MKNLNYTLRCVNKLVVFPEYDNVEAHILQIAFFLSCISPSSSAINPKYDQTSDLACGRGTTCHLNMNNLN